MTTPNLDRLALIQLGRQLRAWRESLELRQEDVAERLGWQQTEVSRLERGAVVNPSFQDLMRLGAVYGLSPNDLAALAGWRDDDEAHEAPQVRPEDPAIQAFVERLRRLTPMQRERLLPMLDRFLTTNLKIEARDARVAGINAPGRKRIDRP